MRPCYNHKFNKKFPPPTHISREKIQIHLTIRGHKPLTSMIFLSSFSHHVWIFLSPQGVGDGEGVFGVDDVDPLRGRD